MEVVGSVSPEEVPERPQTRRQGVWPALAQRTVADLEQGRVTVVKLTDEKEYRTMMNNMVPKLRKLGYFLRPVKIQAGDGLRVFLELELRERENGIGP